MRGGKGGGGGTAPWRVPDAAAAPGVTPTTQRKNEVEKLNEQLRKINVSLRQQARSGTIYAPGVCWFCGGTQRPQGLGGSPAAAGLPLAQAHAPTAVSRRGMTAAQPPCQRPAALVCRPVLRPRKAEWQLSQRGRRSPLPQRHDRRSDRRGHPAARALRLHGARIRGRRVRGVAGVHSLQVSRMPRRQPRPAAPAARWPHPPHRQPPRPTPAPCPPPIPRSMDDEEMSNDQIACRDALRMGKRMLKESSGAAAMVRFEKALMLSKALHDKASRVESR